MLKKHFYKCIFPPGKVASLLPCLKYLDNNMAPLYQLMVVILERSPLLFRVL